MRRAERAGGVEVWGLGVPARRTPPSCRDNAAKRAAILRKEGLNARCQACIPCPHGGWVGKLCRGHTPVDTALLPTSGGRGRGQDPVARGGGRRWGEGRAGARQGQGPGKLAAGRRKPPPSSCRDVAARRGGAVQEGGPPDTSRPPDTCRAEKSLRSAWRKLRGACGSSKGRVSGAPSSASLTLSPSNGREETAPGDGDAQGRGIGTPTDAGSTTDRRASRRWHARRRGDLRLRDACIRSGP